MSQKRLYDQGEPSTADKENLITYTTHEKGPYRGFDLTVNADGNLEIATGYGVLDTGIVWYETDVRTLTFSPPAVATLYTVLATHLNPDLVTGSSVSYSMIEGTYTDADQDAVVLGWINYPALLPDDPLLQEYITSAPKKLSSELAAAYSATLPVELIPPYTRSIITSTDLDLTYTEVVYDAVNYVILQRVSNSVTAPAEQMIQIFQYYVNNYRPRSVELYHNFPLDGSTNITVEIYDTAQAPVTLTDYIVSGTGSWTNSTVSVDQTSGTFTDGEPYTLRITFNVGQGKTIDLSRIAINFWPYPS